MKLTGNILTHDSRVSGNLIIKDGLILPLKQNLRK